MRQESAGDPAPEGPSPGTAPPPATAPDAPPPPTSPDAPPDAPPDALLPEPDAAGGQRALVTCRLCGRPLRGRAARLRGVGDGCLAKLRERTAPRPPERPVEQDPLPGV